MGKLSKDSINDEDNSDRIEAFEDDEPAPVLPTAPVSMFFSRLFNLRREGGRRSSNRSVREHEPAVVVIDEEDLMEKYTVESDDETFSMQDIYLLDRDEKQAEKGDVKYDAGGASQQQGRLQNRNQEARRESTPGAFRVSPSGGPAPTAGLHRYDSNADLRIEDALRPPPHEDILVEASIVPPSRPEPPQQMLPQEQQRQQSAMLESQHPVVEAKPMVQPPKDAITINKRRVIILACVTVVVILALAVGLGVSLTRSMGQSNISQPSAFENVTTASPLSSPTKPPKNGGGGGGGSSKDGQGGGGSSNNNRRLRR
jgi:hypothetical protein